ncbi:MAG: hypothetical protein HY508_14245 [Acidobacteria bacterium]|nr:hypothetical protein [Acidobacteriota bacterium]
MSDRKYRQRGYQDSGGGREPREKRPQQGPRAERMGPRTPNLMGKREVVRCSSCAALLPPGLDVRGKCLKCGLELHSCKMCTYFDTSARFECSQPITARIPRKDAHNDCQFFLIRSTVERETSSSRPLDARAAFENLFKK